MPQPRRHITNAQRQAAYRTRRRERMLHPEIDTKAFAALPGPSQMPGTVRWRQAIAQARALLEMVEREMQIYFDDRSDTWKEAERGTEFQERLDAIAQAREHV